MTAASKALAGIVASALALAFLPSDISTTVKILAATLPAFAAIAAPVCDKAIDSLEALRAAYATAPVANAGLIYEGTAIAKKRILHLRALLWMIAIMGAISAAVIREPSWTVIVCAAGILATGAIIQRCVHVERRADAQLQELQRAERARLQYERMHREASPLPAGQMSDAEITAACSREPAHQEVSC